MQKTFAIDCFATSKLNFSNDYSIVAIDILRASTTITTAISHGYSVFLAANPAEALDLAKKHPGALLVGEQAGMLPLGFNLQNSPVQISRLHHKRSKDPLESDKRPEIIMVSSSGVPLILSSSKNEAAYVCCLRNISAMASHIAKHHRKIAIIGAGTSAQFRREDQIGCALLGQKLKEYGFEPESESTLNWVDKWSNSDIAKIGTGKSAAYLRKSQQEYDLQFTLKHLDDLKTIPKLQSPNEIISTPKI